MAETNSFPCEPPQLFNVYVHLLKRHKKDLTSGAFRSLVAHRGLHCCQNKDCWVIAALMAYLTLAVCLLLGHQTFAKNDAPCQLSKWNNGYDTFIRRHVRHGTPTSLDQNEWENYIKNNGGCVRPTQSFLDPKDLDRVRDVCTSRGGKAHMDNLCISKQPFTFVTVRSEMGTCSIRSIRQETKHLILACEVLSNQCLPVHFEGNPDSSKPNNNARGCQDSQSRDHASSFKMTWLWLLSALLVGLFIYSY
ncbi:uncharacterized protein [Enoplosus armatus]|uniref:uncharacterized protein n=1 Tax=Enoplosus armatus TaxID=215367 RepID=UPI003993A6E7